MEGLKQQQGSMQDSEKLCNKCGGKLSQFHYKLGYCEECREILQKESKAKDMKDNPGKYMEGFPKRFLKWDFESVMPKYQKLIKGNINSNGLFLTGKTGSGKTCLMCVLAKEMVRNGRVFTFKNVSDLLFEIKSTFDKKGGIFNDYDIINNFAKKPYLILDDIGSEKVSEYVRQSLYVLINKRYLDELPTYITSNLTLDEIAGNLDDRVSSRIAEMTTVISLGNKDLRLERSTNN